MSLWCSASRSWVELLGDLAPDEPPPPELAAACACSSWPLSSLTRHSRFCSLSMTLATPGSASCGATGFDAAALLVRRSRRRAHLGGRSVDGKTQAKFARRHLEHGDCLSQRTLRVRHRRQLRNLGASAGAGDGLLADAGEVAFFSEPKAEAPAIAPSGEVATDPVTASTCDILHSIDGRYYFGPLVVILSLSLTPLWCCEEADTRLFLLPTLPYIRLARLVG